MAADRQDARSAARNRGPVHEVDAGRYYAEVVDDIPMIFRADTAGAVTHIEACPQALEAAERALADAERVILGNGSIAWVGSLVLEGVRICLREGRWPDSQECANALAERQQREYERSLP